MKKDFSSINTENLLAEQFAIPEQASDAHEEKPVKRGRGRPRIQPRGNDTAAALARSTLVRGQQQEPDAEEKRKRAAEGRTQGRRGCYLPHINMRFTTENEDYIKTMAPVKGQNMTQFVNECVKYHRERHARAYERIKGLREEIDSNE